MTKTPLNFELVSPEQKLIEEPVAMAVLPGEMGELGVGANHAAFVVALQPGVVKLYKDADPVSSTGSSQKVFITGGFADISDAGCSVLAEEATPFEDLSEEAINAQLETLHSDLDIAVEDADKTRLLKRIKLEKSKLYALQNVA